MRGSSVRLAVVVVALAHGKLRQYIDSALQQTRRQHIFVRAEIKHCAVVHVALRVVHFAIKKRSAPEKGTERNSAATQQKCHSTKLAGNNLEQRLGHLQQVVEIPIGCSFVHLGSKRIDPRKRVLFRKAGRALAVETRLAGQRALAQLR